MLSTSLEVLLHLLLPRHSSECREHVNYYYFPFYLTSSDALCIVSKYTRVEAGSNTSTVNLRVVRGDEMGLKRPRHSLSG
jgi:hypothetical protein